MSDEMFDSYFHANGSSAKLLICKCLRRSGQAKRKSCRGQAVVQPARAESSEYKKTIRVWHGRESCDARKWFYSKAMGKGWSARCGRPEGARATDLARAAGRPGLEQLRVGF